ncbi:hypothetical protein EYE40_06245 [Glaciihabitans arcticus]|uniref:Uncharacterized protein n=1 Tax=Glaciihabitans arcticus TaxID=2668039 RepID=A0A4Q9GQU2_9MICO|nr:hypothetical protein [Glaciihabitans arcticus]TBN57031.1 hypothetical protein EYE40_06245 [Glaciihabitans arcticus]
MTRSPLLIIAAILLAVGLLAGGSALLTAVSPVTVTLPASIDPEKSEWSCGSLPGLVWSGATGYFGGEQSEGVYEFVTEACPPAGAAVLTRVLVTTAIGLAALLGAVIVFLVHLRRARAAASG